MEGIRTVSSGYIRAKSGNLNEFLFLPVRLKYWKHHELWDGTYTLDDLLDIAEIIAIDQENRYREEEYQESLKGV